MALIMPTGPKPIHPYIRFMRLVRQDGECWRWSGAIDKDGYGQLAESHRSTVRAHRWSYEYHIETIEKGMQIDHLCRTRDCVNPFHLEAVTSAENTRRGRNAKREMTHCMRGHEFNQENTLYTKKGRDCRVCTREAYARNKSAWR